MYGQVISNVISFLPYNDQKVCRLVCQTWNIEVIKSLRKLSRVRIDARGEKQLDNLVNCPPPLNPTLFNDFSFGPGVHLQNYLQEENQILKRFFQVYGPNVKSLSINNCICSIEDLKAILYHGCPNLESLRFIAVITGRLFPSEDEARAENGQDEDREIIPKQILPNLKCLRVNVRCSDLIRNTDFMIDLMSVAPNLDTIAWIRLAHDEVSYDRNFQLDLEMAWSAQRSSNGLTIRDTIYDVAIHHPPLNIKKLTKIESSMRLSNSSVMALRDRQFPLQYLDINLVRDVSVSSLTTLLESLSGTLKSLKIEFYPSFHDGYRPTFPPSASANTIDKRITHGLFHFPKMEKLEHIFLKNYAGSFQFLLEWKALKSFSCCDFDVRDYLPQINLDLNHSRTDTFTGLSSTLDRFQIFIWDDTPIAHQGMTFSLDDIGVLAKAFPNLSQVRGVKGISPKKRRHWFRRLEKLKVLEEVASEEGIGGLKAFSKNYENSEFCYCCAHKKMQRLPGQPGGLSYWS